MKDVNHKLVSGIVECYEFQKSTEELEESLRDEIFVFFKSKEKDNIDYLIFQISNLIENMKSLEAEQKQLEDNLATHLKIKS